MQAETTSSAVARRAGQHSRCSCECTASPRCLAEGCCQPLVRCDVGGGFCGGGGPRHEMDVRRWHGWRVSGAALGLSLPSLQVASGSTAPRPAPDKARTVIQCSGRSNWRRHWGAGSSPASVIIGRTPPGGACGGSAGSCARPELVQQSNDRKIGTCWLLLPGEACRMLVDLGESRSPAERLLYHVGPGGVLTGTRRCRRADPGDPN